MATKDVEELLEKSKKEIFSTCSYSEMIRELIKRGLQVNAKGKREYF